ncbi:hypothetical protein MFLAVUS_009453 [Mucor flavus]|uniref:Uncharacterized protein n=1 Tax=Mucor flavus TaxID=439312 RepID=A0ABP9ZA49_9FUNG
MSKEAIAKYALKSFAGSQSQSSNTSYQKQQEEIQVKKNWWKKTQAPHSVLSLEEQKILKRVKGRAHFLDRGLSCCCFQIGFDGIVGFIPVIGDFIGLVFAIQLVHMAMEADIPPELISRMMFNVGFDFMIGLVPIVGDIIDIMYKCNTKNAILFESYLIKRRKKMLTDNPQMDIPLRPVTQH